MDIKQYKTCFSVDTGSFPGVCTVSFGYNYDELMAQFKEWNADGWAEAISKDKELIDGCTWVTMIRTIKKPGQKDLYYYYIIVKEWFDFSDNHYCYLAHEVHHLVTFVLSDLLDLTKEHEATAYTHTHVMGKILEEIRLVELEESKKEEYAKLFPDKISIYNNQFIGRILPNNFLY